MRKKLFLLIRILTVIVIFHSCDPNRVYENYQPIGEEGWNQDSVLNYSFRMKDSAQNYNLYFNLRNTVNYPYSNIWLFVHINPPKGKTLTDTVEFILADPSGRWFGSGHGKFRDNKLMYRQNVYFPDTGAYRIEIQQGMREKVLRGISDFGVRIEKTNK